MYVLISIQMCTDFRVWFHMQRLLVPFGRQHVGAFGGRWGHPGWGIFDVD